MSSTALARIPVGVVVERRKAKSPWLEYLCRPVSVLVGVPAAAPWTVIRSEADVTTFYAGEAAIELYRTDTAGYRDNLASGAPQLWVILRVAAGKVGFDLISVTADPAEGEALTGVGNDLVEPVPMPAPITAILASFIAEHHVERAFVKRQRDRAKSQSPARSGTSENEK